jgi:hypothetical protein
MYNAIQNPKAGNVSSELVDRFWLIYAELELSDIDQIFDIFEIILKSRGLRTTNMVGWRQDFNMPTFPSSHIDSFQYEDEINYEEECTFTSMMEILNSSDSEVAWKMKLKNYFIWLGYKFI